MMFDKSNDTYLFPGLVWRRFILHVVEFPQFCDETSAPLLEMLLGFPATGCCRADVPKADRTPLREYVPSSRLIMCTISFWIMEHRQQPVVLGKLATPPRVVLMFHRRTEEISDIKDETSSNKFRFVKHNLLILGNYEQSQFNFFKEMIR